MSDMVFETGNAPLLRDQDCERLQFMGEVTRITVIHPWTTDRY